MSLTRELSAVLTSPTLLKSRLGKDGKKVGADKAIPEGTPVIIVGDYKSQDGHVYFYAVTADGELLIVDRKVLKITITKDLRERLAEASLVDTGGGGR